MYFIITILNTTSNVQEPTRDTHKNHIKYRMNMEKNNTLSTHSHTQHENNKRMEKNIYYA